MKKILILLAIAITVLGSCRKKEYDTRVVKVSYPTITLKGDKYVSLNVGTPYTDPGATGTDDVSGSTSNIMAGFSSLDVTTPGVYYMSYSMKNANGFVTTVGRYIAVTNYADGINLEGTYERTSNGVEVHFTKVSRALYMTDDMGGAGLPDAAYFAVIDDSTIDFSAQLSESLGAEIDASSEALVIDGGDTTVQYRLAAPGYGTALRRFVKVE